MTRDDLVDEAVLLGLFCRHVVVALRVVLDALDRLPGVLGEDLVQALARRRGADG